jgi:hypothetical protein
MRRARRGGRDQRALTGAASSLSLVVVFDEGCAPFVVARERDAYAGAGAAAGARDGGFSSLMATGFDPVGVTRGMMGPMPQAVVANDETIAVTATAKTEMPRMHSR